MPRRCKPGRVEPLRWPTLPRAANPGRGANAGLRLFRSLHAPLGPSRSVCIGAMREPFAATRVDGDVAGGRDDARKIPGSAESGGCGTRSQAGRAKVERPEGSLAIDAKV